MRRVQFAFVESTTHALHWAECVFCALNCDNMALSRNCNLGMTCGAGKRMEEGREEWTKVAGNSRDMDILLMFLCDTVCLLVE
uniref:Secreted protein n=1 Tax=Ascaris lumbricoides TaxID=6252 RepID=A0A0M3HRW3_ASCLU